MAAILYHRSVEITIFYAGLNHIVCRAGPFYAVGRKSSFQYKPFTRLRSAEAVSKNPPGFWRVAKRPWKKKLLRLGAAVVICEAQMP